MTGDFEGKLPVPVVPEQPATKEPGDDQGPAPQEDVNTSGPEDDDIPF